MRRKDDQTGAIRPVSGPPYLPTLLALAVVGALVALVTLVTGGTDRLSMGNPPTAGAAAVISEMHTVTVGGFRRTYRSVVPARPGGRVPLLIVLHGRGQSESTVVRQTGFLGMAEQHRAVLVFPDGEQRSWNAGHGCCGVAGSRRVPDVQFVAAIVADAVHRWPVDVGRVYLVGYSNGGKLAYSAVCAHPKLFAAVATYGAVPLAPCEPGSPPVPYLLAAGAADPVLPFHGKPGGHPPLSGVPQALAWLRSQDGCTTKKQTAREGSAVVQRWADCVGKTEVESIVYPRWGHTWPGTRASGRSPTAASLIWTPSSATTRPGKPTHRWPSSCGGQLRWWDRKPHITVAAAACGSTAALNGTDVDPLLGQ
ncbi:MAG: alpha/beta hydrolase family esterase [Pseudonocardiaceae bacterium]